ISLSTTSCSKDDDNGSGNNTGIIGTWELSKSGGIYEGQEILFDYEHEAPQCGKDHFIISGNSNGKAVYFYLDFDDECEKEEESFNWNLNGDQLTISEGGEQYTFTVMTLNSTTLKISETYYDEDFEEEFTFIVVFVRK